MDADLTGLTCNALQWAMMEDAPHLRRYRCVDARSWIGNLAGKCHTNQLIVVKMAWDLSTC